MLTKSVFDKWIHFDSDIKSCMPLTFQGEKHFILQVSNLEFTLPNDITYSDLGAFLFIKMTNTDAVSIILQNPVKLGGVMLPIRSPGTLNIIDAYLRGVYKGEDEFHFSILDSKYNQVVTERILVTIHMFEDKGQSMTN